MCDDNHKYVNQGACLTYLVSSTNFWIVQDEHWHRGLITMSQSIVISRKSVHYGTLRVHSWKTAVLVMHSCSEYADRNGNIPHASSIRGAYCLFALPASDT